MEGNDGEEIDDVHEGIGGQGILVHDVSVRVSRAVPKISRQAFLETVQKVPEMTEA